LSLVPASLRAGVVQADAAALPFADDSFDVVAQFTTLSSILDPGLRRSVADEMRRVLRPGGAILWYDMRRTAPGSRTVPLPVAEIRALFPRFDVTARFVTLAPPLARRLAPRLSLLADALAAAPAEVARYLGARPVFVDVHRGDLNIEAAAVERAITKRTKAIVGVDIGGQPCDWHLLRELARPRDIVLVDDAAHALPASLHGRRIGTWADITAFSFYATKTLTTGEGGMLVTDNGKWADRAEVMALHGISRDAWKRYTAEGTWRYEVIAPGFKYNRSEERRVGKE